MSLLTNNSSAHQFQSILAPFVDAPDLPLAQVLSEADVQQTLADEQVTFGQSSRSFWTPALTLWAFLGQVLGEFKSCREAVARVVVLVGLSRDRATLDTAAYCRARAKVPAVVLKRLALHVGTALEAAADAWRWQGRDALLVDGFTASAADTVANQAAYPQPPTQKPGLGFPIIRFVVLLSLATAAVRGLTWGPYAGKETGEPALFRQLLAHLQAGQVVVADRFYCSYFLVALLRQRGVDVVVRLHQRRRQDLRGSRRLGRDDHVVLWHKPDQPAWMDAATYAAMPATIQVRQLEVRQTPRGYRVRQLSVVTTLLDAEAYPAAEVLALYHERWQAELDIRAIKVTLQMEVFRCLSPAMLEREIWAHMLGYNLVRKVAAQAAVQHNTSPRAISFTAALQVVRASWSKLTEATPAVQATLGDKLLTALGKERVGDRPGRVEPRAIKRRPKSQKLLRQPRAEARAALLRGDEQEK